MLATAAILAAVLGAGADLSAPGPYLAASTTVTVGRPDGSTFAAILWYPATQEVAGAPIDPSGAPYPAVTFGHGFLQPVSQYTSTLRHLATHGILAIASQSQGGLFPDHAAFALDLRHCLTWLELEESDPASALFGAVDTASFAAAGHSMGGGAAILATTADPRIVALATTAAADTAPSSIAAMSAVTVPARLIVGSEDSIVPPAGSAAPMYANASGPRQLATIQGGFHCGFTDGSFLFCDSGAITRAEQLAITRRLLAEFLLLHLAGDQSAWTSVWGPQAPPTEETVLLRDPGFTVTLVPDAIESVPGLGASVKAVVANDGPVASSFTLFAETAADWSLAAQPITTPPIEPGASAAITVTATGGPDAVDAIAVVSARRDIDGATRTWAPLELLAAVPTPDLDGDGIVDGADLGILLAAWGSRASPADLNEDGVVDGADLGMLLAVWE